MVRTEKSKRIQKYKTQKSVKNIFVIFFIILFLDRQAVGRMSLGSSLAPPLYSLRWMIQEFDVPFMEIKKSFLSKL